MKSKIRYSIKVLLIAVIPSFLVFSFLMFPFSDLGNLVSTKIAEVSGNQVLLNFKKMGFKFLPSPGLELQTVSLRAVGLPLISLDELAVSPSIAGLLSFKPGVRVMADGFYGGSLLLNTKGTEKTSRGVLKQAIDLELTEIALLALLKELSFPIKLEGGLSAKLLSEIDPSMGEQPEADLDIDISPFKLMGGNINTGMMGMISLPPIALKNAVMAASLKQNKLEIADFTAGSIAEPVKINLKGSLDLRFKKQGSKVAPSYGPYSFELEINAGPEFERDFGVYLSFLEQYKTNMGVRNIYKMKISGLSFSRPPRMEAI